jgi:ABC-type transport system substrate-binding protein
MVKSIAALTLLVLVGCSDSRSPTISTTEKTITLSRIGDYDGFNPFYSTESWFQSTSSSDTTLLSFDPKTMKLVANHAAELKIQNNSYRIRIHPNWQWSNGAEITSDDYVTACQILSDMKLNVPNGHGLFMEQQGHVKCSTIDRYTLRMTVPVITPHTEYMIAYIKPVPNWIFAPVYKNSPKQLKSLWQTPAEVISAGPFKPISWQKGQEAVFGRNPYYRHTEQGFDLVRVKIYQKRSKKRLEDFIDGKTDLLLLEQVSQIAKIPKNVQVIRSKQAYSIDFLTFNWENKKLGSLFAKREFRLGIASLINRNDIQKKISGEIVNSQNYPVYDQFKADVPPIQYNPLAAIQLLKKAGLEQRGKKWFYQSQPFSFTIAYNQSNQDRKIMAELIAKDTANIGLKVIPQALQDETWAEMVFNPNQKSHQAILFDLGGGNPVFPFDAMAYTCSGKMWMHQKSGSCQQSWEQRVTQLATSGNRSLEKQTRTTAAREIQKILRTELPSIPLISKEWIYLARQGIRGFYSESLRNGLVGAGDLSQLSLEMR